MGVRITGDTEPSHYIEGVVEMMMDATSHFVNPLTDDRLFGWHNCLFPTGRSGMEVIDVSGVRTLPHFEATYTYSPVLSPRVSNFNSTSSVKCQKC